MTNKAILRTQKHKSNSSISRSDNHTHRKTETPNSNPQIDNKTFIGSGNIVDDVTNFIEENEVKHIIKTGQNKSVLSVEFMITASPDFFTSKKTFEKRYTKDYYLIGRCRYL